MKKKIRMISLGLAICLLALGLCACDPPGGKSDEQKIRDRVNAFAAALEAGDADAAVKCLDIKNRTLLTAALSLGGDILDSIEIDANDILTQAIGLDSVESISAEIQDVDIASDTTAVVSLTFTAQAGGETVTKNVKLDMVKELGDWYIYFDVDWTALMNSLGSLG